MNLCLFFEGTGRGVAGKITNVTRLRDICVDDVRQMRRACFFSGAIRLLPRRPAHTSAHGRMEFGIIYA